MHQAVRDHRQCVHGTDLALAARLELAQTGELLLLRRRLRLDPAEHLVDPSSSMNQPNVALMTGGAAIDG